MNAEQFFRLVEQMRKKQKEYFDTRSPQVLKDSKELEKQVDTEIKRVNQVLLDRISPTLDFGV